MTGAFVDSSVIVAIAFGEAGARRLASRLQAYPRLFASPLLEAEVRSAARRERQAVDEGWFAALSWVIPPRPLTSEVNRVLERGYLRGADCWHLATALYLAAKPDQLPFLSVDQDLRRIAVELGFPV